MPLYTFLLLRPTTPTEREVICELHLDATSPSHAAQVYRDQPATALIFQVGTPPLTDPHPRPGDHLVGHGPLLELTPTTIHSLIHSRPRLR